MHKKCCQNLKFCSYRKLAFEFVKLVSRLQQRKFLHVEGNFQFPEPRKLRFRGP